MRAKGYNASINGHWSLTNTPEFRTQIMEKIQRIVGREDKAAPEIFDGDMRIAVTKVLEKFQREIIQRNIWIRIYDDLDSKLPVVDQQACQAIGKIIEDAIRRHQPGRMLAYLEISFLINEIGVVVTVEDNACSMAVEEFERFGFLQERHITTLTSGYTIQAIISDADDNMALGQVSVRCVADCFTRFTICFPY